MCVCVCVYCLRDAKPEGGCGVTPAVPLASSVANPNYHVFMFHTGIICDQSDGHLMRTSTLCADC